MTSGCIALVENAVELFNSGDEEAFLACFHDACRVIAEPELALGGELAGKDAIRDWAREARARWGPPRMTLRDPVEYHRRRVAGDVLIISEEPGIGGGWRISFAIWFEGDVIAMARLFWHRDEALGALVESA